MFYQSHKYQPFLIFKENLTIFAPMTFILIDRGFVLNCSSLVFSRIFASKKAHFLAPIQPLFKNLKEKGIDFSFIEEGTKDLYAKVAGRPSYPPEVMFKILFLEFYYNLSDVEVVKQLRFNVLFRYFVETKIEDPLPDDTSLVVFRKRLGEERFERIFDEFVKQCKNKGLLEERVKAVDATRIVADVPIPNTVNLLTIKKRKMKPYIPEKRKKKRMDSFIYTEKEDKFICERGYSSIGKTYYEDAYVYYFPYLLRG